MSFSEYAGKCIEKEIKKGNELIKTERVAQMIFNEMRIASRNNLNEFLPGLDLAYRLIINMDSKIVTRFFMSELIRTMYNLCRTAKAYSLMVGLSHARQIVGHVEEFNGEIH